MVTGWRHDEFGYPIPDVGPHRPNRDADGLSTQQRRTIRQRNELEAGRHPLSGLDLLDSDWGYTCGDCAHAFRYRPGNRTVWKCRPVFELARGSSEATDLRVGWPACTNFRIDSD